MTTGHTEYRCRSCGICCVCLHDQEVYCDVDEEDIARLSRSFVRKNVIHLMVGGVIRTRWRRMKAGPFRGCEANVCVALRGSLMSHVCCSIYERRPRACRIAVQPGEKSCREARKFFQRAMEKERA